MNPSRFSELKLSKASLQAISEVGYEKMTPIQAQAIPVLLSGQDLIGQAKTGSGKTAAFSLPLLDSIRIDPNNRILQALVLCPTRELCTQVAREIRKLGRHHSGLQVMVLSGGQPIGPQIQSLENGIHIAVGTPGRIIDHLIRKTLDLRRVGKVILDEADRMLDMGFQDDMEKILSQMPKQRQTVLFSATFPKEIDSISKSYQKNPVKIFVDQDETKTASIKQIYYEIEPEEKTKGLIWMLTQNASDSAIVFCNLKATVQQLAYDLKKLGVAVDALHGDLEQFDRDRVLAKFRNKSTRILIATDVAARGLDIENLDVVYNYDLPGTTEVYTHRIGRTGRAGKKGLAILFVTSRQKTKVPALEKELGAVISKRQLTDLNHLKTEKLAASLDQTAQMETLRISGGRKEKVRPADILGALTGESGGLKGSDVGKIEIHDHFSYVAVSTQVFEKALKSLNDGKIKGRRFRVQKVG